VSDSDIVIQDFSLFTGRNNLRSRNPLVLKTGAHPVHNSFKLVATSHSFWGLYVSKHSSLRLVFEDGGSHLITNSLVTLLPPWKAFRHLPENAEGWHCYVLFDLPYFPTALAQSIAPTAIYLDNSQLLKNMHALNNYCQDNTLSTFSQALLGQQIVSTALLVFSDTLNARQQKILHEPQLCWPRILPAIEYIHHHLEHSISVNDLADLLGVSPDHCTRLFKKNIGQSPIQYILSLRVARASDLLLNSNHSLETIATACGFPNRRYLSRRFVSETGMPPGQFRSIHSA